jgi:adenylate kinase
MVGEEVSASPDGLVLDGFPRNAYQFEQFIGFNRDFALVAIDQADDELVRRATGRRICEICGDIYSVSNPKMQPDPGDLCRRCGGDVIRRPDDEEGIVRTRLEKYRSATEPILAALTRYARPAVSVSPEGDDVDATAEDISERIKSALSGGD